MTTFLRVLASFLPARLVVNLIYVEHVGPINHGHGCEDGADDYDGDTVGLVLPEPTFYDQLVEAGMRARNGDDPHDVAREAIAELRLAEAAHDARRDEDGDR